MLMLNFWNIIIWSDYWRPVLIEIPGAQTHTFSDMFMRLKTLCFYWSTQGQARRSLQEIKYIFLERLNTPQTWWTDNAKTKEGTKVVN